VRTGVANDAARIFRDKQPMGPGLGELREPWTAIFDGDRIDIERDGRVDDVVVVDLGQAREVVGARRANGEGGFA
jgi:hypothetical protein